MHFLSEKDNVNPHLLLLALKKATITDENQHSLQRIAYLAKTRMFAQLQSEVSKHKDLSFSTLDNKLQKAKQVTQKEKAELNEANLAEFIKELEEKAKDVDGDDEEVDLGQMSVYKLAKIYFDEGEYEKSLDLITQLEKQDLNDFLWVRVSLARLYCELVLEREEAKKTLDVLKKRSEQLDSLDMKGVKNNSEEMHRLLKKQYAKREELLILALFTSFNQPKEEDFQKFVDICTLDKSYFSTLQLFLPELIRYISVAMMLNKALHKNRLFDMFKLVQTINRGIVQYNDVFIDFLSKLFISSEYQQAAATLEPMRKAIKQDIFLCNLQDQIIESCQFLYYKVHCKIYQSVSLHDIAKFINKPVEQAELWILKFLRSLDIDGKIDAIEQTLVICKDRENLKDKYIKVLPTINTFINNLVTISGK